MEDRKKKQFIIFMTILGALILIGYYWQSLILRSFISVWGPDPLAVTYTLIYSSLYILWWLSFLFFGLKRNSKKLLNGYIIFWLVATAFIIINRVIGIFIWPYISQGLDDALFLGRYVFVVPIDGFDYLMTHILWGRWQTDFYQFYVNSGFRFAFVISVIMTLLGLVARRKAINKY